MEEGLAVKSRLDCMAEIAAWRKDHCRDLNSRNDNKGGCRTNLFARDTQQRDVIPKEMQRWNERNEKRVGAEGE